MKKTVLIIFALVLSLLICACSSNMPEQANLGNEVENITDAEIVEEANSDYETAEVPETKVYSFGETVTTNMYEFTPIFEGFAKALSNHPDADFLTPNGKGINDYDNPFVADKEKTMIYFSAVVNYIGDSKENETFEFDFTINYDTDYNFEFDLDDLRSFSAVTSKETPSFGSWDQLRIKNATTFEPLSSDKTRYFRFCMEVPEQLGSNADKILVKFNFGGKNYTYAIQ